MRVYSAIIGVLGLLAAACEGGRRPPYVGGEGIIVVGQKVSVDPVKVPLVPADCAEGRSIEKHYDGRWICGGDFTALEDRLNQIALTYEHRLDALTASADDLETRLRDVERTRGSLEAEVNGLEQELSAKLSADRRAPYAIAAVACVPKANAIADRLSSSAQGRVAHRVGALGSIALFCPVIGTSTAPEWTTFAMTYTDPDGRSAGSSVSAELEYTGVSGPVVSVARLDSNSSDARMRGDLAMPLAHAFDFRARHYFVEVTIDRTSAALAPEIVGVRLGAAP